jgi:type IV secretion system protein VirB4
MRNRYFVVFVYQPQPSMLNRMAKWARRNDPFAAGPEYGREFEAFETVIDDITGMMTWLSSYPNFVRRLEGDDLEEFMHSCISTRRHPIKSLPWPVDLPWKLVDQPFLGGMNPTLGWEYRDDDGNLLYSDLQYIRVITLKQFPPNLAMGVWDKVLQHGYPLVRSTRWLPSSKAEADADLKKAWNAWYEQRRPMMDQAREALNPNGPQSTRVNRDAMRILAEIGDMQDELSQGMATWGKMTSRIIITHPDAKEAFKRANEIVQTINANSFEAYIEDINAAEAFIGAIPGHAWHDAETPGVTSAALSMMVPVSGVWDGPTWNEHLNCPPLIVARTNGNSLRRISLHYSDLSHLALIGESGGGKTFALNLLDTQFVARTPEAGVARFDRKAGGRIAALCHGGSIFDPTTSGVQPYRHLDTAQEMDSARDWTMDVLLDNHMEKAKEPDVVNKVHEALEQLATKPPERRDMASFVIALRHKWAKSVMEMFTPGAAYGRYFGGIVAYEPNPVWQSFELDNLIDNKAVLGPMMTCLARMVDRARRGRPYSEGYDELWMLQGPFRDRIEERVRLARSFNVGVKLATQSVFDLKTRAGIIEQNCPNRLYVAGKRIRGVTDGDGTSAVDVLMGIGLTGEEIDLLENATPKKHYVLQGPDDTALIDFMVPKGGVTAAVCNTGNDVAFAMAAEVLAEFGRERFLEGWLIRHGLHDAAEKVARYGFAAAAE